jgi:hypothetical protein
MCEVGLDGDSEAWAQAGRAMVDRGQSSKARALFRDWRERRGVRMWSLANYMQCLSRFRRRDLEEVSATCRDALADLPHDHCAHYLPCLQAEACALSGDRNDVPAVWRDRRGYLDGELRKGDYVRTQENHLIRDIPEMIEDRQRDDHRAYWKLLWRFRRQRVWNRNSRAVFRIVARIILMLQWIIGMALIF